MTQMLYDELWHYSERFSRDPIQRSELLTMAWKEGQKLDNRCTTGLMKSMMHFRSKELNKRSAFPLDDVGKKKSDVFNQPKVWLDAPVRDSEETLLAFLLPTRSTPIDHAITNDFLDSLSECERNILDDLSAGYTMKEIQERRRVSQCLHKSLRTDLETKAAVFLM